MSTTTPEPPEGRRPEPGGTYGNPSEPQTPPQRPYGYDGPHTHRFADQTTPGSSYPWGVGGPHQPPRPFGPYPSQQGVGPNSPMLPPGSAGPHTPGQGTGSSDRRPPRRGALIVAAALVAGVLGGVGGAAGYAATGQDSTTASGNEQNSLATSAASMQDTKAPAGSVEAVAAKVLPSVVKIDVLSPQGSGTGSGIIVSSDGEILTNNHVVAMAASGGHLVVSFNNGKTADAHIVGRDPLTDLAIIQAEGVSGLTPATLGNSANLDVGEQVVAVGSPFGLDSTVTSGIVSALNRPVSTQSEEPGGPETVFPAIQTDAAINPGNSGGPLVNMRGQVIGIDSAIQTATSSMSSEGGSIGLGFAIPINEARPIARQLSNGQTATHARIGVTVTDAQARDGLTDGARVVRVMPGSAGDNAGLHAGDVITGVNGSPVTTADGLVADVRSYRPGDRVTLQVLRDGSEHSVEVTLDSDGGAPTS